MTFVVSSLYAWENGWCVYSLRDFIDTKIIYVVIICFCKACAFNLNVWSLLCQQNKFCKYFIGHNLATQSGTAYKQFVSLIRKRNRRYLLLKVSPRTMYVTRKNDLMIYGWNDSMIGELRLKLRLFVCDINCFEICVECCFYLVFLKHRRNKKKWEIYIN